MSISFQHLVKTYGRSGTLAVNDLTLEIGSGEIVGFLGPNGAGKTTTIKMLVGILPPDNGSVSVAGIDVWKEPLSAKRHIGYVPDAPEPYGRLTGREYVRFVADVYQVNPATREQRLEELAMSFELEDALGDRIQSYSRGMKQKISLVAALIHQPKVWVLDEPMVGLDPKSAHLLKERMRQHCDAGNTVFFSTHVLDVAERVCDRVAIIHRGRVIADGTVEALRALRGNAGAESLEQLFLELTAQ